MYKKVNLSLLSNQIKFPNFIESTDGPIKIDYSLYIKYQNALNFLEKVIEEIGKKTKKDV